MRRRDWVLWFLGTAAAVMLPAAGARGDYVQFDDSQPTGVTVGANGFIRAPLTLNGSQVLTTNTYSSNQYATLPKGVDVTFQGSDTSFSTPYTFSTTYIVLPSAGSATPAAELDLTGTPGSQGEQFNGRFIGYGDPNLPATIPAGAATLVADSIGSTYFTSGQGAGTTGFAFVIDPRAVPEPAGLLTIISVVAALGSSSRGGNNKTRRSINAPRGPGVPFACAKSCVPNTAMALIVASLSTVALLSSHSSADVTVYRDDSLENNFIPLGDDGTDARPIPGDHLGNHINLLPGTPRQLTTVDVVFGGGNDGSAPLSRTIDVYTATIYTNDGAGSQPSTLIATSSATVQNDQIFDVVFTFANVVVPDTFTVVLSSSHPTDSYNSAMGLVGPLSTYSPPDVGSASAALWSNTDDSLQRWSSDGQWALDDGATTTLFAMTVQAVPEPLMAASGIPLVFITIITRHRRLSCASSNT